jgi:hypothetical protein
MDVILKLLPVAFEKGGNPLHGKAGNPVDGAFVEPGWF